MCSCDHKNTNRFLLCSYLFSFLLPSHLLCSSLFFSLLFSFLCSYAKLSAPQRSFIFPSAPSCSFLVLPGPLHFSVHLSALFSFPFIVAACLRLFFFFFLFCFSEVHRSLLCSSVLPDSCWVTLKKRRQGD